MNKAELTKWYDDHYSVNEKFRSKIEDLIRERISDNDIRVHSITSRVKEKDSFLEKYDVKKYKSVGKVMDLVGIRIITHILEGVKEVCELVEKEFKIDRGNSEDKLHKLKNNKMGYRSVHYIAKVCSTRSKLSDWKPYKGKVFEIQIRTILQHAWAEMSHDSSYKFSGVLPSEIDRHFYLTAGTLELIDREFQRLSDELAIHKDEIKEGNLQIEITTASLGEYLSEKLKSVYQIEHTFNGRDNEIIQELKDFDINTIKDLEAIISPLLENEIRSMPTGNNYLGFLRDVMMLTHADKYFKGCWSRHWVRWSRETYDFMKKFIDVDLVSKKYKISIEQDEEAKTEI